MYKYGSNYNQEYCSRTLEIMKIVLWAFICVSVGGVFSAPVAEEDHQDSRTFDIDDNQADHQHDMRLENDYYAASPCASGSSNVPVASFHPDMSYQTNIGPSQVKYFSGGYGPPYYSPSWYRAEDAYKDNREMLRYSDMNSFDQTATGNGLFRTIPSSYGHMNTANVANFNAQVAHQVGTAYGVFPNANVGDCNIPLLLSCSPSIVTGQIMNPDQPGLENLSSMPGRPSHVYRGINGQYLHGVSNHEQTTNNHPSNSSPVNNVQNKVL